MSHRERKIEIEGLIDSKGVRVIDGERERNRSKNKNKNRKREMERVSECVMQTDEVEVSIQFEYFKS